MKRKIKPVPCVCGCKTITCIHGQPSGRVFAVCASCFRKTPIKTTTREAMRAWNNKEIIEPAPEGQGMSKREIKEQFAAMTESAKRLIDTGEPPAAFGFGIADAAAELGGKNPQHAAYCHEEAKKRIAEIFNHAAGNGGAGNET